MQGAVEPWLLEAARARVKAFSDQLRSVADTNQSVPNLDWTVADLGQHVAGLPAYWLEHHAAGDHFELPADFGAYSDQARAHITESDPARLAQLVDDEMGAYVDELASGGADRWIYGRATTAANMCGSLMAECVLHGRDLAAVTGVEPPALTRSEALVAVEAMMVITPVFVDAAKAAAAPDGVYHVHFRGGRDFTWTKSGATFEIAPGRPAKADAHLNADPAAFVMTSLGRMSEVRAGLTGKVVVYGSRPWRFAGLGGLAIDGV